jgi:hypothetical protein
MWRITLSFLILLTFISVDGAAGELVRVWELRLSELPGSKIADATAHVFSVSFSPDGHRLAAVVRGAEQDTEVLTMLSLDNPRGGNRAIVYEGPVGPAISWSSTGEGIAVPAVFHALRQSGCTLEHSVRVVFYDSDRVADVRPGFPSSDISFFDSNCEPVGSWDIEGKWELSDGSADRHLLALSNYIPKRTEIIIVDPLRKKLVRRWPLTETEGSRPLFADNGNAVCAIDGTGRLGVAHCWDVNSDREIARMASGNPHDPMATALHARRVALSDYGWKIDFERWQTEVGSLEKRVVWDFGTGKEIASWKPRYQDDVAHPATKQAYEFAISPDGTMVAEGGAGVLTLYRIEP